MCNMKVLFIMVQKLLVKPFWTDKAIPIHPQTLLSGGTCI